MNMASSLEPPTRLSVRPSRYLHVFLSARSSNLHNLKKTGAAANDGSPGGHGWRWIRCVQKKSQRVREPEREGEREKASVGAKLVGMRHALTCRERRREEKEGEREKEYACVSVSMCMHIQTGREEVSERARA